MLSHTKLPPSASFLQKLLYPGIRAFFYFFFAYVPYWPIRRFNKPELKGPFIWACSHSNFLCDVIPAGWEGPSPTKFLGKSTLFVFPIKGFIEFCGALPVVRAEDAKKTGENKSAQNRSTFKAAIAAMEKGWPVAIFPEGMSTPAPGLVLPFKPGVAKLAFAAEEANNFNLDLKIIPVGLEYGSRVKVASGLSIRYGNPIRVKEYEELFRREEDQAVKSVMERLTQEMISCFPHFENEHTLMLGRKLVALGVLPYKHAAAQLFLRKKEDKVFWDDLYAKLHKLEEQAKDYGIPMAAFGFREKWKKKTPAQRAKILSYLVLGSPLFFIDLFNNTIPETCVKSVVDYVSTDETEKMTIRFMSSPIVLGLVYGMQFLLLKYFVLENFMAGMGWWAFLAYYAVSIGLWYAAVHWRRLLKIFASLAFFWRTGVSGRDQMMRDYRDLLQYLLHHLRHADDGSAK